ncbi:MAG: DUF4411 family protein [Balneolales bacterium]|nr:DUF4411 family protein [Balneolales bacterium]
MPIFVLDSNVFISSHQTNYPFDVVPGFWNQLEKLADKGQIVSIDKVRSELFLHTDELTLWVESSLPSDFFKSTQTNSVVKYYTKLTQWATSSDNHYLQKAIDEFLEYENADAWLVAFCKANDYTLITQEVSNPWQKNRIPLPQACVELDVPYQNLITLFRDLNIRF